MSNLFFASIKKTLITSTTEVRALVLEKNPDANAPAAIQQLTIDEYAAVAGGPQVQNTPEL